MTRSNGLLEWLATQPDSSFPKGSPEWMLHCTLQAAHQRFLALGAAVANLEARVIELEAWRDRVANSRILPPSLAPYFEPLGAGPLEPEKIGTTDAPGG